MGQGKLPPLVGLEMILRKGNVIGCTLIGIFCKKITLSEKRLLFGVLGKAKFSGD